MISKISESEQPPTALTSVRVKTPRRILHFSDGVMEEYSTDDEVDGANRASIEVRKEFHTNTLQRNTRVD